MTLPYTNPTPTDWAEHELRMRMPGTELGDWTHTTADGGRPCHTARVLNANAADRVRDLAAMGLAHGLDGAQQRPVLDYSRPECLELAWLFNGEWIVLWAPDTAETVPGGAPRPCRRRRSPYSPPRAPP